jgi:multicomponent K+:H+ antiporter subunit G
MTALDTLPPWLALPVALLLVIGGTLTLLGALGLLRLRSFYERIHAPTLGTSWGTAAILLASLLSYSWLQDRLILHEIVIGLFVMITTPVTLMLLGAAALKRDREGARAELPQAKPGRTGGDKDR